MYNSGSLCINGLVQFSSHEHDVLVTYIDIFLL